MKIKIDSLEFVYKLLKNPPLDNREAIVQGEEWKFEEPKDENQRITPFNLQFPSAGLLAPLEDIAIHFKRFGENYSAIIIIDSINQSVFKNTYNRLSEKLKAPELELELINNNPTRDESAGKIFNRTGSHVFEISAANHGKFRVIALGTHGAYTREFPQDFETFHKEINILEQITNTFIACLMQPYAERPDVKRLENELIYLNP